MSSPTVTVFSDFSCPYSHIVETAVRKMEDVDMEVVYRAFELYPEPSELPAPDPGEVEMAVAAGLTTAVGQALQTPSFRPRTRKAHEAARFAGESGREAALREAIFTAYWVDQRDVGRIDVLMELAERVGIEPEELKIALDIDRYSDAVVHDTEVGRRLRIPGTPTVYLGTGPGARVVAGAIVESDLRAMIADYRTSRRP